MPYDATIYTDILWDMKDTFMDEFADTTPHGAETVGNWGSLIDKALEYRNRPIFQFDVSELGATLVFWWAALRLYVTARTGTPEDLDMRLKDCLKDGQGGHGEWTEDGACWEYFKAGSLWTNEGGDYTLDPVLANSAGPTGTGWWQCGSNPSWASQVLLAHWVVHAIQEWSGELHTIGISYPGAEVSKFFAWASKDHATVAWRPVLRVWCEPVETGALQVMM